MNDKEFEDKLNKIVGQVLSLIFARLIMLNKDFPLNYDLLLKTMSETGYVARVNLLVSDQIKDIIKKLNKEIFDKAAGVISQIPGSQDQSRIIAGFKQGENPNE